MNFDQVTEILTNTERNDWVHNGASSVYKGDLNLRITEGDSLRVKEGYSPEPWAKNHPDPNAYEQTYQVWYGNSLVSEKRLVVVDGARAILPYPDIQTKTKISHADYKFAKILDGSSSLEDYIFRSGLSVQ